MNNDDVLVRLGCFDGGKAAIRKQFEEDGK
jgi:hypothetical protein